MSPSQSSIVLNPANVSRAYNIDAMHDVMCVRLTLERNLRPRTAAVRFTPPLGAGGT